MTAVGTATATEMGAAEGARAAARRKQERAQVRVGWGAIKDRRFLDTLAATGSVRAAAAMIGTRATVALDRRRHDAGFARDWAAAIAEGQVRLEEELLACALAPLAADGDAGLDPELAIKVLKLRGEAARPRAGGATPGGTAVADEPDHAALDAEFNRRLDEVAAATRRAS